MPPQAWKLYNRAIRKLGAGTIQLPGAVRCALVGSGSNFNTATLSLYSQLTDEVPAANGYTTGGVGLTGEAWTAGTSAGQIKFDANDPSWVASGGAITSILGAVLYMSGASAGLQHMLARASLSSANFNLASGSTLTLQFNTAGIFTAANA